MSDVFVASYLLLWIVVVGTAIVALGSARQVALITRRLPPEMTKDPGPKLGTILPPVTASALLAGDEVQLPIVNGAWKSVLVFMEDGCSKCVDVIPKLRQLADELEQVSMHVVLEKPPDEDSVYRQQLQEWAVVAPTAFDKWRVSTVPFALVINEGGMVEAKGHLIGEIGRLAETLGIESLEPQDTKAPIGKESVEYERVGQQA